MAKVIVINNRKGGVGKTTIATHLAAGLACAGFRVGIVDTDSQCHCAVAFGFPKANGLYEVMTNPEATLSDNLYQIPADRFAPTGWEATPMLLLPGSKLSARIAENALSPQRFRAIIRKLRDIGDLEYIIVDTAPSNTMFDGMVMMAADYYLIVTEPANGSFDGLASTLDELRQINEDTEGEHVIKILGIIPNKIRATTKCLAHITWTRDSSVADDKSIDTMSSIGTLNDCG